jgi:ferredoxin-thioredoxin reductase catalytic chain
VRRRFPEGTTVADLKEFMVPFVERLGYKLNTDAAFADAVLEGEIQVLDETGDVYCPCRIRTGDPLKDSAIICPCIPYYLEDFSAMRKCWCGLFIRSDVEDGAALHGVITRPPGPVAVRIAAADDLRDGQARQIHVGSHELAIFNVGGDYFCLSGMCRHVGGLLGEGYLDGHIVMCPKHGWRYDVRTGTTDHPDGDVKTYPVAKRGGELFVTIQGGTPLARVDT